MPEVCFHGLEDCAFCNPHPEEDALVRVRRCPACGRDFQRKTASVCLRCERKGISAEPLEVTELGPSAP